MGKCMKNCFVEQRLKRVEINYMNTLHNKKENNVNVNFIFPRNIIEVFRSDVAVLVMNTKWKIYAAAVIFANIQILRSKKQIFQKTRMKMF